MFRDKPRYIPLYAERTFSQRLTDTFEFVRQHWRVLLRTLLYLLLPVCLVQSLCLSSYTDILFLPSFGDGDGGDPMNVTAFALSVGGLIVLGVVGMMLVSTAVYALMRKAEDPKQDIDALTLSDLRQPILWSIRRELLLFCVFVVIGFVAMLIIGFSLIVSVFAVFLIYLAMLVCMLPLLMLWPACLLSDDDFMTVVPRALRYGFNTWGGIFATVIVVGMLVNVATNVAGVPYYVLEIIRLIFRSDSSGDASLAFASTPWYMVLCYLFGVFYLFVSYLGYGITTIALGYQYGHAAERNDGVAVQQDVDRFETLDNDSEPSVFDEIDDFERL